jgi:hypothetical protein
VFWAIIGGIGAALLLPGMQSLIHGNFEGPAQKRVYALVGASAAIAAAIGPLVGGLLTTTLSWRVGFAGEAIVIAIVLSGASLVKDVAFTGPRRVDVVGALLSVVGMGGLVLGVLVWQEGGDSVGALLAVGVTGIGTLVYWLLRRRSAGRPTLVDPTLFRSAQFRLGVSGQLLQQITLGGAMIVLPIYFQMVLEYNALEAGLALAPLSLSMFGLSAWAGRHAGRWRSSAMIGLGYVLVASGLVAVVLVVPRADSGWAFALPLVATGSGLGLLVSQLNNYTLAPVSSERVSEASAANSAAGSFGLSLGLALAGAIMLAALSTAFDTEAGSSEVLPPAAQDRVSQALEDDAQVMSNTHLEEELAGQPPEIRDEILRINTDVRPLALQIGLLVPIASALTGLAVSYRMTRLPDVEPSPGIEGVGLA